MDKWTDRFAISISRVSMLTRDKNEITSVLASQLVFTLKFVNHSQTSKNPFAGQLNNLTAVREFLSAVE